MKVSKTIKKNPAYHFRAILANKFVRTVAEIVGLLTTLLHAYSTIGTCIHRTRIQYIAIMPTQSCFALASIE